jgi:hypothetical protein
MGTGMAAPLLRAKAVARLETKFSTLASAPKAFLSKPVNKEVLLPSIEGAPALGAETQDRRL